jgi:MATE family multidrug resistance protein
MGLWLSVAYALAILPLMFWSELLLFRGQDPGIGANAQAYMRIAGWAMFPALLAMVLKSSLSALERTRIILWSTLLAAVCNAVANWALIFGNWGAPELGLRGAAIASVVSQSVAALGLAAYAHWAPQLRRRHLLAGLGRPDWAACNQVLRLGWPIGLTMLAEAGLFAASAIMMGFLGETVLAAHGIALELASITFMVHLGLSQVGTVRAGQAHSRGDAVGLRRGATVVALCSVGFSVAAIASFLLAPDFLVALFLSADDPRASEIIAIGVSLLLVAAIFQLADGAQVVALGLLRGLQDTRLPMFLAAFSYWVVGAPAGYALGFIAGYGGQGVWFGLVLGLALAAVGLTVRFVGHLRQDARTASDSLP